MSASDIGIRISLVGGKETALQAAIVADSLKGVGDAAKAAGESSVVASGGIDALTASTGKLTESSLMSTSAIARQADMFKLQSIDTTLMGANTDKVLSGVAVSEAKVSTSTGFMGKMFGLTGAQADAASARILKFGKDTAMFVGAAGAIVAYETAKMALGYDKTTTAIAATANISIASSKKIADSFLHTTNSVTFNAQAIANAFQPVSGQLSSITHGAVNANTSMMLMNATMNLATASGQDLSSATASVTDVLMSYTLGVDKANYVSNILYNTSRLTANATSELATTMDRLHSRLGQVMPSLADTSGLIYDLAKHGAAGSRGTLMVTGALTTLLGGTVGVNSMLNKLGINVTQFYGPNGKFIGMAKAIDLLQPKLDTLTQRQQLLAEKTLFGAGASQLMGQVVLAGSGAYDTYRAAITKHNAVQDAANKVTKSLGGQIDLLKKDMHNAGIDIGQFILPKLVALGKWMSDHKPVIIALAGVIASVLVVAMVAWGVSVAKSTLSSIQGFGRMGKALFEWATQSGASYATVDAEAVSSAGIQEASWGAAAAAATSAYIAENLASLGIIAGITLLIAAVIYLAIHWKQTWDAIKNGTLATWHFIDNVVFHPIASAFLFLMSPLNQLGKVWNAIWGGMKDAVRVVWDFLKPIIDKIIEGFHLISKVGGFFGGIGRMLGFAEGGVVPGPAGAPMLAMVHGGEVITPPQNIYNASGMTMTPVMLGQAVSKITPGSASSSAIPSQIISNNGGGSGQPTVIQLVVDRKVLAELVYTEIQNSYARR